MGRVGEPSGTPATRAGDRRAGPASVPAAPPAQACGDPRSPSRAAQFAGALSAQAWCACSANGADPPGRPLTGTVSRRGRLAAVPQGDRDRKETRCGTARPRWLRRLPLARPRGHGSNRAHAAPEASPSQPGRRRACAVVSQARSLGRSGTRSPQRNCFPWPAVTTDPGAGDPVQTACRSGLRDRTFFTVSSPPRPPLGGCAAGVGGAAAKVRLGQRTAAVPCHRTNRRDHRA